MIQPEPIIEYQCDCLLYCSWIPEKQSKCCYCRLLEGDYNQETNVINECGCIAKNNSKIMDKSEKHRGFGLFD